MNRRKVLGLFAGVAVAGVPSFRLAAQPRRFVIAGGGIIGANIAYQLARRGASVTLLERSKPASGATANSFAWINAKKRPLDYFNLSRLGLLAWRTIDREFGGRLPVMWGGSVEWRAHPEAAPAMREQVRAFQAWGYGANLIDATQLRALERNVVPGSVTVASHWTDEGHADPVECTEMILAEAVKNGATVRYPSELVGLDTRDGKLRAVKTTNGDVEADILIVACGTDTPRVAAMAGIKVPLQGDNPGVLVHVAPQPRCVERVLLSPVGNIKQKPNGRIVAGSDFGTGGENTREAGEKLLKTMSTVLPQLGGVSVDKMTLGYRPIPMDGRPIVGFQAGRSDIYIAVMHSGMTLGPLIGRFAAMEPLDGVTLEPLSQYRLERFKV
jgi:glycine/D-amino acid oxidase-like deaminating enzyme